MKQLLLIFLTFIAYQATSQLTGLEAHYTFDNGTFLDQSGNGNHATNVGSTAALDRFNRPNHAREFNGSNQSVRMADSILGRFPVATVSLWFKTSFVGSNPILGYQDDLSLMSTSTYVPAIYIIANGELRAKFWDGTTASVMTSSQIVNDGKWHHVLIRAFGTAHQIYLDNQLVGSGSTMLGLPSCIYSQLGAARMNGWPGGSSTRNFTGVIDDVRVFNQSVTNQVKDLLFTEGGYPANVDTLYVNASATGNNNGSSWADAYTDPRDAFIASTDNDEVWIAQGTYKRSGTNRALTFGWTSDSLKVYGGFSGNGTETSINQRDWDLFPTIFSGDIGVVGDSTDNAYTVFYGAFGTQTGVPNGASYSYVDGIKIAHGTANVDDYPELNCVGGGMAIDRHLDKAVYKNIELYNNYAKQGGAISIYNNFGGPLVVEFENIVAHHNYGRSSPVGHIRSIDPGNNIDVTMKNCLFYENIGLEPLSGQIQDFGSVLFFGANTSGHTAKVINCTFANNMVKAGHRSKGVIRIYDLGANSTFIFQNNILYGNVDTNNLVSLTQKNNASANNPFDNITVRNNLIQNGTDFTRGTETATITSDPLFSSPSMNDFSLSSGSPAINAGSSAGILSWLPQTDLAGNARVFGTSVDIGAYEFGASVPVGLTQLDESEESLVVYPNPTDNVLYLKGVEFGATSQILVFNTQGQVVLKASNTTQLDVSQLTNGIYIVQVADNNQQYISRFVKN